MTYKLDQEGELKLKAGDQVVSVFYRRPAPKEIVETLVAKMPTGDEDADAQRVLMANLELGGRCVTGVGEGEFEVGGEPLICDSGSERCNPAWQEVLMERAPILLIALGQYLSAAPSFVEGPGLKKS